MYQALYRKYRPQTLEDIAGQDIIIKILSNSIINNKISHAYLFCGPRGTGKTSIAKIMAKIVNCSNLDGIKPCEKCDSCKEFNNKNNTDIIEIDAASNNGVDEIRELKNKINLVPTLGKYKVYIIDEVHMLTIGAFNALLKTLEEPPSHALFILATTEPHKIPITILSRCQRLDFKKISIDSITNRLKKICSEENIVATDEALTQIANLCDGGMRDSISMLDKLSCYTNNNITYEDVNEINGLITTAQIEQLIELIQNQKYKELFELLDNFNADGKNFSKLLEEIILYLRNVLVNEIEKNEQNNLNLTQNDIIKYIETFSSIINDIKTASNPKIILETNLIKLMTNDDYNEIKEKDVIKPVTKKTVKVETFKEEKKQQEEKIDETLYKDIEQLKNIRVSNTLSDFNKKKLLEIKEKLENVNTFLIDPEYSSIAGLILDGTLKAASDKNLIFVYESDNVAFNFNMKVLEIEQLLSKLNVNMSVIAVNVDDWNVIKQEFNSKTKTYSYEDDSLIVKKIFKSTNKNNEKNSIESMFDDIIKYN